MKKKNNIGRVTVPDIKSHYKATVIISNSTPGGILGKTQTLNQKDTCTPMFIAALFTVVRTWKQPKCPLTDEWLKKMWYIYTMEYYSAIKRNEIGSFVETWMRLESIIQSEVKSEREKQISYINAYMWNLGNGTDEPFCRVEIETQK